VSSAALASLAGGAGGLSSLLSPHQLPFATTHAPHAQ
jgi:hypothetical protein